MSTRFWSRAEAVAHDIGWRVLLDGRPVRLPSGAVLTLPNAALAGAVADEWQAAGGGKGGAFGPVALPMTRLAGSAQERVAVDRSATVAALMRYAGADVLCYRVDRPESLALEQVAEWEPWLAWAERRFGARLRSTTGIGQVAQPETGLTALREALMGCGDDELAALGVVIPALGSCVLGLALAEGAISPEHAVDTAFLEELHQERHWGADAEGMARRGGVRDDVVFAARFMRLLAVDQRRHA